MMVIQGVYTALVTPFDGEGELDLPRLRQHVLEQQECGVDGVVVLGSTGEAQALSQQERECVIGEVISQVKGQMHVMVGVGTNCTRTTVEVALQAEELGADSLLVVTPYYACPSMGGLVCHFEALCDVIHLPICIYHNPGRTGCSVDLSTAKQLCSLPQIVAWKESTGDVSYADALLQATVDFPQLTLVSGNDDLTLPIMALGGHGVISVVANIVPRYVVALVRAVTEGRWAEARRWHRQLTPFFRGASLAGNPASIKAMMALDGRSCGEPRLPLTEPGEEAKAALRIVLEGERTLHAAK